MAGKIWLTVLTAVLLVHRQALGAAAEVDVADGHGHPLADAVVELTPAATGVATAPSGLPRENIIDQRHETFLPLVTLIGRGGHVIFTNNDTTMHQVYSFSPIRQFAFEIDRGQRSEPVTFDKPGVAAIGCNIHDQMITYVYVAGRSWAALSDGAGRAMIADLPAGAYRGSVWHPRLEPGAAPLSFSFLMSGSGARTAITVQNLSAAPLGRKRGASR
jgi:plastocyanin